MENSCADRISGNQTNSRPASRSRQESAQRDSESVRIEKPEAARELPLDSFQIGAFHVHEPAQPAVRWPSGSDTFGKRWQTEQKINRLEKNSRNHKSSMRSDHVVGPIDRFQRNKSDPPVIVFSEIKRCQRPHSTHFFKKQKRPPK